MVRDPVERVISWYYYVRAPWYFVERKRAFPDLPLPNPNWLRKVCSLYEMALAIDRFILFQKTTTSKLLTVIAGLWVMCQERWQRMHVFRRRRKRWLWTTHWIFLWTRRRMHVSDETQKYLLVDRRSHLFLKKLFLFYCKAKHFAGLWNLRKYKRSWMPIHFGAKKRWFRRS